MLKKTLSLLLAVVMLLTAVPMSFAAGTPTIAVGDATVDISGGTASVTVPVSIENNPGFAGMDLSLSIPEGWTISSIKVSTGGKYSIFYRDVDGDMEQFANITSNKNNGSFIAAYGEGDITADGVLCWVTYKLPASELNGEKSISVTINKINNNAETGVNMKDQFDVNDGTVTVTGAKEPAIIMGTGSADVSGGTASVTLPVTIQDNIGFAGMDLILPIPDGWTISSIKVNTGGQYGIFFRDVDGDMEQFANITSNKNNGSFIAAYGEGDITADGVLCWVTYKIPAGADNGTYTLPITINKINNNTDTATNLKDRFTLTDGEITVTGGADALNQSNTAIEGLNASYPYNDGNAVEPTFTVLYNGNTLTKGTDYTVSYENNVNVGTATVTVTGTGSYKGSVTATFEIVKKAAVITGTASYTKTYGDTAFTLDAAADSGAALSYTSANTNVATVDASGKVTVVGAGTAVITVSAGETANYAEPNDFKVTVTVGKAGQTLTGTASYTKTYGDAAFDLDVTGAEGTLSYRTSDPTVADVDASGKVTVVGAGTAVITASATETENYSKPADFDITVTVGQKEVSVLGIEARDKTYDGTTTVGVDDTNRVISGMLPGDDLDIEVTGEFEDANAGENKTVYLTVTLIGNAASNYKLAADSQSEASATIEKKPVAVPTAKTGLVYNTTEQTGVTAGAEYTVTGGSATNAGNYTATVTLKDAVNYEWRIASFNGTVAWSIAKADASDLTMTRSLRYNDTSVQTITAAEIAQLLNAPGNVEITACTFGGAVTLASQSFTADAITYALAGNESDVDKSAEITATISSENYNDVKLTVTVNVQNKIDVSGDIVFANGEKTYTGKSQTMETATYNGSSTNITYSYSADPINVGTYTVTATYSDAERCGTAVATLTIKHAAVRVTGATAADKVYDGTTDASVTNVTFSGLVNGETLTAADYTVSNAAFANANVGTKAVNYDVTLATTGTAANYVLTGTVPAASAAITAKPVAVTVAPIAPQAFNGSAIKPVLVVTSTGTVGGYTLLKDVDYTVSYEDNTNAGTAKAVVTAKSGSNYTFTAVESSFTIDKAAAPTFTDLTAEYLYSYTGNVSFDVVGIPVNAGTTTLKLGALDDAASMISNVTFDTNKVNFTVNAVSVDDADKTATVTVTIEMQNYADATLDIVITRSQKNVPVLTVEDITKTYDGKQLTADDIEGTATFNGTEIPGTWSWDTDPADMVNANEAGYTAIVKFTPDNTDEYLEAEIELTVVINKATPTGQPGFTKIQKNDQTLADAGLNVGTITPAGTIAWVDAPNTKVEMDKAYQWVFTPNDTTNYKQLTGTLVPYPKNNIGNIVGPMVPIIGGAAGGENYGDIIDRFYDVQRGDWFADAVAMVVSEGLFEGVSYNYFQPNSTMTRAMLVTVLWRLAGQPVPYTAATFTDVSAYDWYADAVAWAQQCGVVDGVSETKFAPDQSITREQMAAILHRYAKYVGFSGTQTADLSVYTDSSKISSYAVNAMSWAVAKGLITGMTETTLAPKGTATRAQVATILMRFVEKVL